MYKILTIIAVLFFLPTAIVQAQTNDEPAPSDTIEIPERPEFDFPVIGIEDIEGDAESHDISSLLQGSRDVYVSTAGFTFGQTRYRIRGYDNLNTVVMMNGIPVNDPETGRVFYSNWGGLNDATRMTVTHSGIGVSRENFGGIGGATNITTRASRYGPNTRITYSNANRSYTNRAMFLHSTGMQENGWALTLSGSRRIAAEGYVEGTFYDAWGYFLSAERRINDEHSIGLIAFGAPSETGRPGVASQEAYNLTGNNYYNPNWGFQNGEVRNSRINNFHTPWFILSHYYDVTPNLEIQTSAAYSFGKGSSTALNWFDGSKPHPDNLAGHDPRPDYYRYFPSFFANDPVNFERYTQLWQNDENFRQLNWDLMYQYNMKNLFTQQNVDGIAGNNIEGNRSQFIIEDRRNDRNQFVFNSIANYRVNPTTTLSGGVNVSLSQTHQYKLIGDLLGGDWWVDIDQFALRDATDDDFAQNDLLNPNRLVTEGDRFGYDFTGNINKYEAFAQAEWILPRWDFYLAANVSQTTFWRTGHMQNGRFPDNSLGDSEKQNFTNFGLKGGTTFKFTGRHYFTANAAYMTRAPFFRNAYISSRVRDDLIPQLDSETIMSGDVSYFIRSPLVKSRLTLFASEFRDQTWSRSFYHEEFRTFVNYSMYGVDQRHLGAELGMDINLTSTLSMSLVAGTGNYFYSNRPTVTITRDNDRELLAEEKTVYWKNFKVGGMTHTAGSVGLRYNAPRFWFVGGNFNYFDDIYLDINPDRRTEEALSDFVESDPNWRSIIDQEKLDNNFTLDIYGGRSWRIRRGMFVNLNISISNVLNNQDFQIGGFEQLRYDTNNIDGFPPKYFYLYGRTYFINLVFRM